VDIDLKRFAYQQMYQEIYKKSPEYGSADHSRNRGMRDKILQIQPKSIIDIGCGNGEFLIWIRNRIPKCSTAGLDFASTSVSDPEITFYGTYAHIIPIEDQSVEMLTSFDFLEHLFPEEVPDVLREFERVTTDFFIFKIAYQASGSKGPNEEELHNTIRSRDWWIKTIEQYTSFEYVENIHNYLVFERITE
jgi:ubiquinone/menaquinone biosynthesis C-methylase UbiE